MTIKNQGISSRENKDRHIIPEQQGKTHAELASRNHVYPGGIGQDEVFRQDMLMSWRGCIVVVASENQKVQPVDRSLYMSVSLLKVRNTIHWETLYQR